MVNVPDWLPRAEVVRLEGRGEVFVRVHRHPDPSAPVLLLLHGWTASADTQWVFAYPTLTERYSVVAVDHHGHGRGLRSPEPFDLARVADDAAATVRALGFERVISVGYSMGGPVSMHLWRWHPDLVAGMVLQATALEWRAAPGERLRWHLGGVFRPALRAWWFPRLLRRAVRRLVKENPDLDQWVDWVSSEALRNDPAAIAGAARALSRYDARPWAGTVAAPVAFVVTTKDRFVKPHKQHAMATAIGAEVFEIPFDHYCSLVNPVEFAAATLRAVDSVVARVAPIGR